MRGRRMKGAVVLSLVLACSALPMDDARPRMASTGAAVSLVGEGEGQQHAQKPEVQVPIRGPEQAEANAAAAKLEQDAHEAAAQEAVDRQTKASTFSKAAAKMSTADLDRAMSEMDADRAPIDVMASKYKALQFKTSDTPASIVDAERHAARVGALERKMKHQAKAHTQMLEQHTKGKIPTLEGMKRSIETTINANMKEELKSMPYRGEQTWDSLLPTEEKFHSFEKLPVTAKPAESDKQEALDAEGKALTQRQKAISIEEKRVEEEKQLLKGQMVKVADAANHLQEKFQEEEDETQMKATKKVHDAAFAVKEAMREKTRAENDEVKDKMVASSLKQSLVKAITSKTHLQKAAAHEVAEAKHDASMKDSYAMRKLKRMCQTKIHGISQAATKIAKQLFIAKDQIKGDQARLRYYKSKIILQDRQNERKNKELAHGIEKKESRFWNKQITTVEKQAAHDKSAMQTELTQAEKEAAQVAKGALKSQKTMEKLKMPLEAKRLAKQLGQHDRHQVKTLRHDNDKLKRRIEQLERALSAEKMVTAKQAAVLKGKDRANQELVALVEKLNEKKQQAEDAAESNAAQVQVEHQKVVDEKEKLTANVTELDGLLKTPCEGESCVSSDETTSNAAPSSPTLLFGELLTPKVAEAAVRETNAAEAKEASTKGKKAMSTVLNDVEAVKKAAASAQVAVPAAASV